MVVEAGGEGQADGAGVATSVVDEDAQLGEERREVPEAPPPVGRAVDQRDQRRVRGAVLGDGKAGARCAQRIAPLIFRSMIWSMS